MPANYQVQQREIPAWVLTAAGWARGKFIIMRTHGFVEAIESSPGLLKMRDVQLPGYPAPLPFFGVWRDAVTLIAPDVDAVPVPPPMANGVVHHVTCLLQPGVITGKLTLRQGIRLSDYLQRASGFLTLEDCSIQFASGIPASDNAMRLVLVNLKQLVGVTE